MSTASSTRAFWRAAQRQPWGRLGSSVDANGSRQRALGAYDVASSSRTFVTTDNRQSIQRTHSAVARKEGPSRRLHASSWQAQDRQQSTWRQENQDPRRRQDRPHEGAKDETPEFNVRITPPAARDVQSVQSWLRAAFPATPFPEDVALQLITHESWDHGIGAGHNRRLAFMGRRALKFYMSLFLAQRAPQSASNTKVDDLLQTSRLGDTPGRSLKLAEVMRWTPAVSDGQMGPKETGLFKIRGVTVEALVGAIYHQHGAQAARSFFHARILPNLETFEAIERDDLAQAIAEEKQVGEAHLRNMAETNEQTQMSAAKRESTRSEGHVRNTGTDGAVDAEEVRVSSPTSSRSSPDSISKADGTGSSALAAESASSRLGARRRSLSTRQKSDAAAFDDAGIAAQTTPHIGTA